MPKWQGKSKGTPLGYRIFVFVCRTFGVRPAYFLLRVVAFYYFLFSFQSSREIYKYFRERHHFGALASRLKVYSNYFLLGQTIVDKMVVLAGIRNQYTYHFDGMQNLKDMVAAGNGGILLSAHVGNWEMASHHLKHLDTSINVVVFDGEDQRIKQYLDKVEGQKNFKVIVIRNDMSHVFEIGAALANNELVCIHGDRFVEGNKTIRLPLLGKEASFPIGPFLIAAGFNVPVSLVFAFKETKQHYHFFGSAQYKRETNETKSEFANRLAGIYVSEIEQRLKQYPLQWFNYYDFWS
jgi:predicted LPLAT superfamily acyltransferase